jgi:CRP-like cAMP-binding protein
MPGMGKYAVGDSLEPVTPPRNRLLTALPAGEMTHLRPLLEVIDLCPQQILHRQGDSIRGLYFPESGYISLLASLEDGEGIEAAVVGREGMVGLPLLLGSERAELNVVVGLPGTALRLSAAAWHESAGRLPAFRTVLGRYILARHVHASQISACNGRHTIVQRLARTLLMAHDHAEDDTFPMTHEVLSMALGVRRPGITVAAGVFQQRHLISYGAGQITVTDRTGLESTTCECYRTIRNAFDRLLGAGPG